jgi:uncharacterized membrane protein YccC
MTEEHARPAPVPKTPVPTWHALRVASACSFCFLFVEWLDVPHANLAVWSTFMVMAQYPFTIFQKGLERVAGRVLGIVLAWILLAVFPSAPVLRWYILGFLLLGFFVVHFAGRLAYTWLNAGLYVIAVLLIGESNPISAHEIGREMLVVVIIGVVSADMVMWLSGGEKTLAINVGTAPLWPPRREWVEQGLMLATTALLVGLIAGFLEFSASKSMISLLIIAIAPDVHNGLRKGQLRFFGAMLALIAGLITFFVVARLPSVWILCGMLFFGVLIAAYLVQVLGQASYAGVQMGLVFAMIVVVPPNEFGDLVALWQRMEGILLALAVMFFVGGLWPTFRDGQAKTTPDAKSA